MLKKNKNNLLFIFFAFLGWTSFAQNPLSDASNSANWILNAIMTDEFNGSELDKTKWWILGENGDYRSKWKGRAPGQYAPHNVKVENGELILTSQWEPNYSFANEIHSGTYYGGSTSAADNSKPITQACVMSEAFFKYGYMEVKAKIADAPVVSAFWTTGYHSEIDMFENFGKRPVGNPENKLASLERKYRSNVINWDPDAPSNHQNWKVENDMNKRLAEDYHIYGFEWDKDYVKTYFDGVLVRHVTRQMLENNNQWRHDAPQELWFDNEVFSWYGLPSQVDLVNPAEFKIDYVRIWQKELNSKNFNALGFEGPFHFQGRSLHWWNTPSANWRLKTEKPASGDFSLKFEHSSPFSGNYSTFSPFGSLSLPTGSNAIKFKIWIDQNTTVDQLEILLNKPFINLKFDLTNVQKEQWVELSKTFNRNGASNTSLTSGDRLQIRIQSANIKSATAKIYIDDIVFNDAVASASNLENKKVIIYPNPTNRILNIPTEENSLVEIYNTIGVLTKKTKVTPQLKSIDVRDIPKGIYIVKVLGSNSKSIQKVIIK
ncbi:family 16 glycosylhydrolase [Polaribacter sp.]|nr:family 16 glycosylhydrolase [Polaribacter sp.]